MLQPTGNDAVDSVHAIKAREGAAYRRAGHTEAYFDTPHRFGGTAYENLRTTRTEFDVSGGQPGSTVGSTRYFATGEQYDTSHLQQFSQHQVISYFLVFVPVM
eukprot:SAG31_NODE_313_length_17858_cov_34.811307_2_plen_103_part_00